MPPYLQHVVYRKATECRFCVCSPFACISTPTSNSLESIPQRMPITGPGPHSLQVVTMTPLDACNASQMHSRCRLHLINLGAGVLICPCARRGKVFWHITRCLLTKSIVDHAKDLGILLISSPKRIFAFPLPQPPPRPNVQLHGSISALNSMTS